MPPPTVQGPTNRIPIKSDQIQVQNSIIAYRVQNDRNRTQFTWLTDNENGNRRRCGSWPLCSENLGLKVTGSVKDIRHYTAILWPSRYGKATSDIVHKKRFLYGVFPPSQQTHGCKPRNSSNYLPSKQQSSKAQGNQWVKKRVTPPRYQASSNASETFGDYLSHL